MNHQDTKAPREAIPEETDRVAKEVVDAAYKIHSTLGPGLLENVYEICMVHDLTRRKLHVERQVAMPILFENIRLDAGLRLDMVVNNCVVIENKAVEKLLALHEAQLLTYLKLSGLRLGLLINFNVPLIKDGIKRIAL
ncbi:MAG: GxxExxY protein [Candidatus Brocadiia bacterium]